ELTISDVFFQDPGYDASTSGETDANGYGIRFYNQVSNATLKKISVKNCNITNVGHTGLKINGGSGSSYIDSVEVLNNTITHVGGPGIQTGITRYARFAYNTVDNSGSSNDSRMWHRGSGLWTWGVYDVLVEHNSFTNANGPGDTAGSHIDYNCTNVVMQYNFSANNAGGFVEILGNNRNCSYRYNVSVNDGWRVKGVNGAFQEGKTLWLSGYVGAGDGIGPYNTYIYNNTIYVRSTMISKYSLESTSQGVLIANNIFHVLGSSSSVLGDQTSTATRVKTDDGDVFFRNNIFLKTTNWPGAEKIEDAAPVYGDVGFANAGGMNIVDYIPQNLSLTKGKGIAIPNLPGDVIGLKIGLKVTADILGNPIGDVLDMGAIALTPASSIPSLNASKSKVSSIKGGLDISNEGLSKITLYSISGMIIQSKQFTNSTTLCCPKGFYIVKVNNEVHKVIVD
ncbi:MAG: right-handed parallel beta-helix repeat-containing protein, partial [Bacteroidia bacterium]|nr:right-handed parallel beta-helix repeat-containing protein [Bacteroidia bacterium]